MQADQIAQAAVWYSRHLKGAMPIIILAAGGYASGSGPPSPPQETVMYGLKYHGKSYISPSPPSFLPQI